MIHLLKSIYKGWKEVKVEIKELAYNIVRNERHIQLKQMLLLLPFRNNTIKGKDIFSYIHRNTLTFYLHNIISLLVFVSSKI